jgi:hypothetical protein
MPRPPKKLMNSDRGVPLFINRFSLSMRISVGVQTRFLLAPHQDWLPRSILLEDRLLSRHSFLHNVRFTRFCERLGIGAWIDDELRPDSVGRLNAFREHISCAYLAPPDWVRLALTAARALQNLRSLIFSNHALKLYQQLIFRARALRCFDKQRLDSAAG